MYTQNFYNPFLMENESLDKKINRLEKQIQVINEKLLGKKDEEIYLTLKETANLCKIKSLVTLYNWKVKGILKPTGNVGRKPLYKKQDVIDFIEKKYKEQ